MTTVLDRRTRGTFTKPSLTSPIFERQIIVLSRYITIRDLKGRGSFAMEMHKVIGVSFCPAYKLCHSETKVSPKVLFAKLRRRATECRVQSEIYPIQPTSRPSSHTLESNQRMCESRLFFPL